MKTYNEYRLGGVDLSMEEEKKNKKKKVMILFLVLGLVLLTIGGTYAFFTYSRQGEKINTLTTGTMYFVYDELPNEEDSNKILISNAFPISDKEGMEQEKPGMFEFEVRAKTQGANINYEVYLTKGTNSNGLEELPEKVIRTYLTSVNEGIESPIENEWTNETVNTYKRLWISQVPPVKDDLSGKTLLQDTVQDSPNEYKKTYRFRMWLGDNADGVDEEGNWIYGNKSFTAHVNVYASNEELPDPIKEPTFMSSRWKSLDPVGTKDYESINFATSLTKPQDTIREWDASEAQDGSVIAYVHKVNEDDSDKYQLTIATDGEVYAPIDSSYLFSSLKVPIDFNNFNTSYVENMSGMFSGCQYENLDLSSFNTSRVTDMYSMFDGCSQLTTLNLSNWDTSNVTNMIAMFNCGEEGGNSHPLNKIIGIEDFNTKSLERVSTMFGGCQFEKLDLSKWNTSSITNMYDMFVNCNQLTDLGDLSGWDTSNVKNMGRMFSSCSSLTNLDSLTNWDVSSVTDTDQMFYGCRQLQSLDLSGWDTSSVTNMSYMFSDCSQLSTIITIRGSVTDYSNMFLYAATAEGTSITVNYTDETETIVDAMIKTGGSNIHKGEKVAPLA